MWTTSCWNRTTAAVLNMKTWRRRPSYPRASWRHANQVGLRAQRTSKIGARLCCMDSIPVGITILQSGISDLLSTSPLRRSCRTASGRTLQSIPQRFRAHRGAPIFLANRRESLHAVCARLELMKDALRFGLKKPVFPAARLSITIYRFRLWKVRLPFNLTVNAQFFRRLTRLRLRAMMHIGLVGWRRLASHLVY